MPMYLRQWAQERATGTLAVVSRDPDPSVTTVLIEDGAVIFATSRRRRDPTGELFLELYQVPDLDPENADEIARIRRQVMRVVADLFNTPIAEASFTDGIHLSRWPKMSLSVGSLLLAGMRMVRDGKRIASWIGSPDQVFVTTTDPFSFFNVELSPDEAFFLTRIADRMRLEEILSLDILDRDHALRLVAALLFAGAIEPSDDFPPRIVDTPPSATPAIDPGEAGLFFYRVEEKLNDIARGVDHYGLLEVSRNETDDRIRTEYEALAREFHPDRYRFLAPAGINVEGQLDSIFDAMTTAYVVLTNARYREIYDRQLADQRSADAVRVPKPARVKIPDPVRPANRPPVPEPVAAKATSAESPASRPEPVPLRPPKSPASNVPPPAPPRPPAASPSINVPTAQLSTSDLVERGVMWAASGDHERAVKALERAILLTPENPRLHLALGHSLSRIPSQRRRAEHILTQCTSMSPFSVQPLVDLATLYLEMDRINDAKSMLKRAIGLKPNDPSVRELQATIGSADKRGASGLLRRFFPKADQS